MMSIPLRCFTASRNRNEVLLVLILTRVYCSERISPIVKVMENSDHPYSLLDLSQLNMLLESGGEESIDLINEILELFEEESRIKLGDLKTARANADAEAFGYASHALAGSSANIGGVVVWQKAKSMENNCKSGDPEEAFALLEELEQDFSGTLAQIKAYVATFQ